MSKCIRHERCPRCAGMGRDRNGNNLGVYSDGGTYCFSCGYRSAPTLRARLTQEFVKDDKAKTVLPSDFSREVPTAGWKWLLQYGLSYSYWKAHCGYSEKENRLIFPIGSPTRFAAGRNLDPMGASKWKIYGDKSSYVEVLGEQLSREVVLVEDIVSAHKVASNGTLCIPLFGTAIGDLVLKRLITLGKPVALWLDSDQYIHLPKKLARIQTLTGLKARSITTKLDPKECSSVLIKQMLIGEN